MATSNQRQETSSPTRRQFLKSTSVAVAAGSLAGQLDVARAAYAGGSDEIRVALVGCGGRGTKAAMQALSTEGPVKLVAMADAFENRLLGSLQLISQKLAERVEVPQERQFVGFDAYQQAIDAGVDLVILTTPPGFRPLHFESAIKAGKHVFMEKPVAVDAPGVRTVLATAVEAKKQSLCVGVGLQRHHDPLYRETIQRLQDGAIGDILSIRAYWNGSGVWVRTRAEEEKKAGRSLTELEYQMRNWYYFNWICGDHIVEQHIHNLDVSNWLKGDYPVKAHGVGGREVRKGKDHGQIFDHHTVEFTYADGTQMHSQCRHIPNCWNSVSEHALGTRGTANIDKGRIVSEEEWRFRGEDLVSLQVEHDDLFAAIRNGTPYNEAENGAKSTMTAILGRMATYSGKLILWKDAIASEIRLADTSSLHSFDYQAPVLPDADGNYPVAIPGVTQVV
ncbi:MAG: Gfo/Idh/MocA family oxidoreductase [Planctomycetes bacterium]|nr:Gfo/Idh/MocA family oxidoreductase [Planctomycetota bacterium]